MAKQKKHNYVDNKVDIGLKKVIIMTVVVLVILGLFYGLTLLLINKKPTIKTDDTDADVEIQYKEILAGRSFSMGEDYLVVYYDSSSDDDISSLISSYSGETKLYQVDLSSPLNKSIYSEDGTSNPNATIAKE